MHYNDQLRLLDSLVDSDEKLPDNTRVTFLESAVESVPDLRRVKITDNVLQAQLDSTRPISYKSYFDLLKDAAFHLDQATKRGNKIRRTNVHFSGPNDEDEHQNLSSDDPQVIQPEDICSEPPEPLSYSVFQSHFQGSSTANTQKIFLPKPIWEKLSKDQQQMIIDHNRSLPKSRSSHLPTPNKSPSPLPHKSTPQQTAKSQHVHTQQSDESTADATKTDTTPSDPLLAMVHQSINTSDDDASDITMVLSAKRSRQILVCKRYLFMHANHTNNQLVDCGANGGLAGSDMGVIHKTHRKINISGIDNHEVTGLDVVTAATLLNTSLGKVIGIFNEYAYLGKGSSIHSSGQLEWFKTNVDEKSIKVGGTQLITTLDGYSVPLLMTEFRQPLQVQSHLEMPRHFGQTLINCIHNQHRFGIPDEYFVETCINTSTHNVFVTKEFVKIDEDSQTRDYTIIYIKFQGQTPPFTTLNQEIFDRVLPRPFPQVGDILSEEEDSESEPELIA